MASHGSSDVPKPVGGLGWLRRWSFLLVFVVVTAPGVQEKEPALEQVAGSEEVKGLIPQLCSHGLAQSA
eukprot:2018067-Prorocentrum_lima.AAC.1